MNRAIELHDTEVTGVEQIGSQVIVFLSRAYIHQSPGIPGRDPGTGCVQAAALLFKEAKFDGELPEWPAYIETGALALEGLPEDGMIPIPLDHPGTAQLSLNLRGSDGPIASVEITGSCVSLILIGGPDYVEKFPGSNSTTTPG